MSDARNSSGNIRGGGAKQTGGSGRTAKGVGGQKGSKSSLDGLLGGELDRKAEAKRHLQLQIMSKQLANSVRAAILLESEETGEGPRTEAEYERFDIPMPDPDTAMRRLKAMKEFTEDWYDADFREQWLGRVCQVWAKELRAAHAAFWAAEKAHRDGATKNGGAADNEAMSIEELEAMIQSPDTSAEERKRLKSKLKKRRQKANKKKPPADSSKGEDDG